jgi:hypothetical protein
MTRTGTIPLLRNQHARRKSLTPAIIAASAVTVAGVPRPLYFALLAFSLITKGISRWLHLAIYMLTSRSVTMGDSPGLGIEPRPDNKQASGLGKSSRPTDCGDRRREKRLARRNRQFVAPALGRKRSAVIRQAILCDVCGTQKRQTNHWFVAYEEAHEFHVSDWSCSRLMSSGAKHLCGEKCLHELLSEFLARTLPARNVASLESRPVTSLTEEITVPANESSSP